MSYAILFSASWLLSSVLVWGLTFAHWQREFALIAEESYFSDLRLALTMAPLGPISLVVLLMTIGRPRHGLKFW